MINGERAGFALLEEWRRAMRLDTAKGRRTELIARYAYGIPSLEAVEHIASACTAGVVELGAGTGYWARVLAEAGVDIVAYDIAPVDGGSNPFFPAARSWFPVAVGNEEILPLHADRTLLLVWPTRNQEWPLKAITAFHAAGGAELVYVGEPPGGRTGDDRFHAALGEMAGCVRCRYHVPDAMCVCDVQQIWQRRTHLPLPHWPGFDDDLHIYDRA